MSYRFRNRLIAAGLALCALAAEGGVLDALERIGKTSGQHEFLHPDEAFVVFHDVADGVLHVTWDIAPGYYLYRDKMHAESQTDALSLGPPVLPRGETKGDPTFGRVEIYRDEVTVPLAIADTGADTRAARAQIGYQGCAEDGICYPPIKKTIGFLLPTAAAATAVAAAPPLAGSSSVDRISASLGSSSIVAILSTFFTFGLLLSLTPCVFPMVPILSGIIVGQGKSVTVLRGMTLSTTYVGAMALTYALAGVAAGMLGQNLQAAFQHPVIIVCFSVLFVLLALAMFGLYELQMPAVVQARLDQLSRRQSSGTYIGVAAMGVLSAVIVGPCVAPPLAGALAYIGQQGDAAVGGAALFALGLGMGAPLIALGASAGTFLPRAGAWMDTIKKIFGVVFLGVAVWFLERVLPASWTLLLWALLLIGSAIFMGALDAVDAATGAWRRCSKGLGMAFLVYGAVLIVGAAAGGSDPLRPLGPLAARAGVAPAAVNRFVPVKGLLSVENQLARAQAAGRPAMLDFYADWCIECKYLERDTFADGAVAARLAEFTLLRADVTANDGDDQVLLRRFGIYGPPAVLFFRDGEELRQNRLVGFVDADDFLSVLDVVGPAN